jgi:Tfp pilus assembly protein PilN
MPIINLIQEQRLNAAKQEQRTRIAYMTFVGAAALAVFGYGIIFYQKASLQTEISRQTAELDKTKPVVDQIEAIQHDMDDLKPRVESLTKAAVQTDQWAHILHHLQVQTPEGTWLTGLQSTGIDPAKPVMVTLQGSSKAQEPIAEYVLRVQNEPNLDNVALHFTQQKKVIAGATIDFEIGGELAGSADKKPTKGDMKSS